MRRESQVLVLLLLLHHLYRPESSQLFSIARNGDKIQTVTNTTFPCMFRSLKLLAPEKKTFTTYSRASHGAVLINVQRYGTELMPSKRACAAM